MSVVPMRLLNIIGFVEDLDSVAAACASLCAFEPDKVDNFFKKASEFKPFVSNNDSTSLEENLVNAVSKIGKKIKLMEFDSIISKKQISKYVSSISEKCENISGKMETLRKEIDINNERIKNLRYFDKLDYSIDKLNKCRYICIKFLKIPLEDFGDINFDYDKFIIEKVSEDSENCYCVLFISEEFKNDFLTLFENIRTNEVDISSCSGTPIQEIEYLTHENSDINNRISKIKEGIESFWEHQKHYCAKVYYSLKEYSKCESIKNFAKIYNKNFTLVGWIPASKEKEVSENLDKISRVDYSIESEPEITRFSPPTKLKNNRIFSPFEFFVSTYGLPKYSDVDPTSFLAITYTIIFGLMFADVGQGFLLSMIGLFLSKFRNIIFGKIMIICGISASIFGFIFGSIFGFEHAMDPIYKLIGFHPIRAMESVSEILIFSVCIGIVCLFLSMSMNIYSLVKKKEFLEAILSHSGICGIVLYFSIIILVISVSLQINKVFHFISTFLALLCLFLIFFKEAIKSNKLHKKINWSDYLLSQFFEMFEVILGYFTNTVSFIRVGVFIFVHTGMMMVVFSLAEMSGGLYPVVAIVGNLFVTCLESLLVGMQVMRLQFCELFGRFFEGGGRSFKPIIAKMKISSNQ